MPKDTILQSFENLLSYAIAEHEADHVSLAALGIDDETECLTCDWLVVVLEMLLDNVP